MAEPIAYGADWSDRQIYGSTLLAPVNDRRDGKGNWYRLSFVLRYADFPGQGHAVLTKAEYESHLAAGIRSLLIYQRTTRDPDGGEPRGREFGRAAVAYATKIGYRKGEPIFGCADAPIGSYNLDVAQAFFKGFAAEVRAAGFLAGGYGFADVIYRLQDRGVVDVLWLCGDEKWWRPGIAIYQWNNGRIYPAGVEADLVKQFEQIPGDGATDEGELGMGDFLVRDPVDGECSVVTISATTQSRALIPNTEVLAVFEEIMQTKARNVSPFAAKYLAIEPGGDGVDEQVIIAGVNAGLIPAVLKAIQTLDLGGLTFEQQVEAVQVALRRGTGGDDA